MTVISSKYWRIFMTGSKLCVLAKPPNAHFYCTSKPVSGGSSWPSEHSPGFPKWGSRQCSPTIRWESLKTLLKIKIWREAKTKTKASCKSKLTTSYIFSFPPVSFSSFNAFDHEVQICKMQRQKKKEHHQKPNKIRRPHTSQKPEPTEGFCGSFRGSWDMQGIMH